MCFERGKLKGGREVMGVSCQDHKKKKNSGGKQNFLR